jgi:DNA polymerase-3 subunit gamma/tau
VAEPKHATEPVAVVKPTPAPAVAPPAAEKPKSVLLGGSLASLLDKVSNPEGEGKGAAIVVDPQSEAKLEKVKEQIIKQMCAERPRFVSAFESISFEGNTVKLAVPSEALKDELLGERFWILKSIAELAGVNGSLDMFIEIKEMDFKLKPIKLEDRVAHIRKVMAEFDYMQKALDMDVE